MNPAIIIAIVQAALQFGVQAEPFLAALIGHKFNGLADASAADVLALDTAIETLEKHIEARG